MNRSLLILCAVCLAGCDRTPPSTGASNAVDGPTCAPVRLVVVTDHSVSVAGAFAPPTPADLLPLIDAVDTCGGTLAHAAVDADAREYLLVYEAEPLTPPTIPEVAGPTSELYPLLAAYRDSVAAFRRDSVRLAGRRSAFEDSLRVRLSAGQTSHGTDLATALERAAVFFDSPGRLPSERRVLLIVSDGVDTVRGSLPPLPAGVRVVGVGGRPDALPDALNAALFESTREAAKGIEQDLTAASTRPL